MAGYALRIFKYFIYNSLQNSPIKILTIQQFVTNSLLSTTQIRSMMAQPYELIDITNLDSQLETKSDR